MTRALPFLLLFAFGLQNAWSEPPLVLLNGDRLTVRARESTLDEVLKALAETGVKVRVDPSVKARVHGDIIGENVHKALKETLLVDYGYSARWRKIEGPVGEILILNRLDVYTVGNSGSIRTIKTKRGLFDIVVDPDGVEYIRDELLVGVKAGTSKEAFMNMVSKVGGQVVDVVKEVGVYRIRLAPNSDVRRIAANLNAEFPFAKVEPNYAIRQAAAEPVPGEAAPAVGSETAATTDPFAPPATAGVTGTAGATTATAGRTTPPSSAPGGTPAVAILDSGLSPELQLGELLVGSYDATNPDLAIADTRGHGSQMALIVSGGVTPAGLQPVGDAEGTPLVAIRSFDDEGATSNFAMMRAIDYAQQNGASVLSLSWGSESRSEFMESSIAQAQDQGLTVVAAVGNTPNGVPSFPAAYDGVIGVGALSGTGDIWERSNFGDFVDVSAPGQADFPIGHDGPPGSYSGTSISTPVVARAFSQYMAQNPASTQEQMLNAFYGSLTPAPDADRYGQGKFDDAAYTRFLNP